MKQLVDIHGNPIEVNKTAGGALGARNPYAINTAYTGEHYVDAAMNQQMQRGRGIQVYYMSALHGVGGVDKHGNYLVSKTEWPLFYLTIYQRNEIFRLCSPIFGVVTSRMNRISALPYHVVPIKDIEDREVNRMKEGKEIFLEFADSYETSHLYLRAQIYNELRQDLTTLKPDLSNFDSALLRWKKRIRMEQQASAEEIEEWLSEPNNGVTWPEFVKKWVYDYHIHGTAAVYKQTEQGRLTNFDCLIGGTVYKLRNPYFSGMNGFVQRIEGFRPQIFWGDEISYAQYVPTSVKNYSMIPLEALINKISESLMFDDNMAKRADGTRPPEKAVIVTNNQNPFLDYDGDTDGGIPIDVDEQKRIEEKIKNPIKNGIVTFSGNNATVVDLTRAETIGVQNARQKDIREEVALVFNMSNMEVNLSGGENTSGRNTSESQSEIEAGKGTVPITKALEEKITRDIITARYGYGFKIQIERQKNEVEERELDERKLRTGEYTKNEIREKYNRPIFDDQKYDMPDGHEPGAPGAYADNPLYISGQ